MPTIRIAVLVILVLTSCRHQVGREVDGPWSGRIAASFLERYPDWIPYNAGNPDKRWNYEQGLMFLALLRMTETTGDQKYSEVVRKNLDFYVEENGSIRTYRREEFNLDMMLSGRALLRMYRSTGEEKYRLAADTLRDQLRHQPRNTSGGFWHKKVYPDQMWLDGIFMAQPFYAEYAAANGDGSSFDDIAHQILLIERKARDSGTGLLYHAWDESGVQKWATPGTGTSPHFWGRAIGWYAMGVVDVLDVFPAGHPERNEIVAVLQRLAEALAAYQDEGSGVWYQVVDQGSRSGNYLEASASAMFTYALAKGVRKGYLEKRFEMIARKAFRGILDTLVTVDTRGLVDLRQVCAVAGLGGNPYRDGTYQYYVSEQQRTNDFKGIGPFLLAALEIEALEKSDRTTSR